LRVTGQSAYLMLILELTWTEFCGYILFECRDFLRLGVNEGFETKNETVALCEFTLEVLNSAETLELTIDHDSETGAEGLTLLHTV